MWKLVCPLLTKHVSEVKLRDVSYRMKAGIVYRKDDGIKVGESIDSKERLLRCVGHWQKCR